jgi:signal peptidase II
MSMLWKMAIVVLVSVIADQVSKAYIQQNFFLGESIPVLDGFFNFSYVRNAGAAFGMGANAHDLIRKLFFLYVPVAACLWISYLIWKTRNTEKLNCAAFTLIFSGAIGNLIDRFGLGYVIDFLDFHVGSYHFPSFNIADSCITVGAGMIILDFLINDKKRKAA